VVARRDRETRRHDLTLARALKAGENRPDALAFGRATSFARYRDPRTGDVRVDGSRGTRNMLGIIGSVRSNLSKIVVTAGAVATIGIGAAIPRPASADTTSTVLTAAAVLGGIALLTGAENAQPPCNYGYAPGYAPNVVVYGGNGGGRYFADRRFAGNERGFADHRSDGGRRR
jgi:hypothetical protein